MPHFTVDPRDGTNGSSSCGTCCCQTATARPGETQKWVVDYAPWSVPIGGKGLGRTLISIEDKTKDIPGVAPMLALPVLEVMQTGAILGPVQLAATDGTVPYAFALDPLLAAQDGAAVLSPTGELTYTPKAGFAGVDRFSYVVTDANGKTAVGEIAIRVNLAPPAVQYPAPTETPALEAVMRRLKINPQAHSIEFPLAVAPTARPGDLYRMTIQQQALDCDCEPYIHVACFDITIGKC